MKKSHIFGILVAIALIIFSIAYPLPEKHLRTSGYSYGLDWSEDRGEEYVGGDAYNYQMEASLKAGYFSGIMTAKVMTFVGGLLLFFLSLFAHTKCAVITQETNRICEIAKSTEAALQQLAGRQQADENVISQTVDECDENIPVNSDL